MPPTALNIGIAPDSTTPLPLAGAVAGVEEADNADEREVRTHELPEDDVPEEYLDKD